MKLEKVTTRFYHTYVKCFISKIGVLSLSKQRAFLGLLCGVISFCTYLMILVTTDRYYRGKAWYERQGPCELPHETKVTLINMANTVSDVLTKNNISHVLCYGSLWGALRNEGILPWDNNVDFCILGEEMKKPKWSEVEKSFPALKLDTSYSYQNGEYSIINKSAVVLINVFYNTYWGDALHEGWKPRFLWFFQDQPMAFPSRLLEPPLPMHKFNGRLFPVPHETFEIQKYIYRDDWWLEKPPAGCTAT